ncbi:MAG: tandem-95 repeat protein, partial [Candidatus Thiodiazotropha sp. (ex Lucinoma kastoroae)]|nr:tandem-95 repeat protein [Candidatus Thiodiazotropha sp. (ex Lucinoma kastoroae)]
MSCSKYLQRLSALIIALPIMFNMASAEPIVTEGSDYCLTDFNAYATVSEVQLRWAYSGAPQYNVYRSVDDGVSYQSIVQITSSDTSYLDSGLITGARYRYAVKEVDSNGLEVCQSPVVHVTPKERSGNKPPVFISTPVLVAQASVVYHYDVDAIDRQDDPIRYSLKSFPAGMRIDSESGVITWIPVQSGEYSVKVRAVDDSGMYDQQGYMLSVSEGSNTNQAPQIISTPVINGTESQAYQYDVDATDAGDLLIYELSAAPVGMTIDATTGQITWIPVSGTAGLHDVTVSVRDQGGLTDTQSYQLGIAQENLAPVISSTPVTTASETLTYQYDVDATDPNAGDTIIYALDTAPADMAIDSATGLITWVPGQTDIGVHTVTVAAADPAGLTDSQSFTLQVLDINHPPSAAYFAVTTEEDVALIIVLQGQDIDGDSITYSIVTQPLNGQLSGLAPDLVYTSTADFNGSDSFTYRTHDGLLDSPVATVDVTISSVNDAPTITSTPVTSGVENQAYQYQVQANDSDSDALSYSLITAPAGMSIDADGLIVWTPDFMAAGDHPVTVTVQDTLGASDEQSYTLTIADTNRAPVIEPISDVTLDANTTLTLVLNATDADGDGLTYSVAGLPSFA